jgi:two-component system CheB/CheR fusion protein
MSAAKPDQHAGPEPPPPEPAVHEPGGDHHPFPIVGVGASAGGLEAFTELLRGLPPNPGMAFLYVQHLEPHHASHLAEILTRSNTLPAQEASDGVKIEANRIYLIPPNANMALVDGSIRLSPRSLVRTQHMPIDHLFRSLAGVLRARAIGVILSGGGTDGTLGFQAIKSEGGITLAQDEKTARHHSMPRTATLEGCVDYVLGPAEIARQLARLVQHPYTRSGEVPVALPVAPEEGDPIAQIVTLLRASTDVDFSHYKRTTITRRIQRRMALRGLERVEDYLEHLRRDPGEVQALYQDFLIRVTQFFRDADAFDVLAEKAFPILLKGRPPATPIRVWVAGCATGEEVYSLAISLLEYMDRHDVRNPVKFLATDLNEAALEKARAGVYVDNIEIDVSPERLRRFFVRVDGHYQISKAIRELCVFSRHNMAKDPPFGHLDLVSCRNVLIYMESALQRRVLPVLHYALNPGGYLLLGSSENVGPFGDLFEAIDPRHRIYAKKPVRGAPPLDFLTAGVTEWTGAGLPRAESPQGWSALDVQREADRIVLSRYAPVGVVVDEGLTVLQFRGRTAPYLEPAPGMASLALPRMLREGLLGEVRAAINQARVENVPALRENVPVVEQGRVRPVTVEVIPFKVPPSGTRFFLVLFREPAERGGAAAPTAPAAPPRPTPADQQVVQLQQELSALRDYLQSVIEEQESTNEELKSANEEILSANEELQSTNEELQTAKEEAQAANEELVTVNDELRHRNAELAQANDDLVNLLAGIGIPVIIVRRDLRIRRFTPLAEKVFNLIPTDVGRPIGDIKPNLQIPDLSQLIAGVIDSLRPWEDEVQDRDGHWYALRIRPYVTLDNKIDGASIALLDIDSYKGRGGKSDEAGAGERMKDEG